MKPSELLRRADAEITIPHIYGSSITWYGDEPIGCCALGGMALVCTRELPKQKNRFACSDLITLTGDAADAANMCLDTNLYSIYPGMIGTSIMEQIMYENDALKLGWSIIADHLERVGL